MIGLQSLKIVVLFGLLLFTFILGLLPLFIVIYLQRKYNSGISFHRQLKYKRAISILSCFAAGVFLGTCMLELLPDVRKDLESSLTKMGIQYEFPKGEFVMALGFFLILIIEQVVLTVKERKHHATPEHIYHNYKQINEKEETESLLDHDVNTNVENELTRSVSSEHSIGGISDSPHVYRHRGLSNTTMENSASVTEFEKCEAGPVNKNDEEHYHSSLRSILLTLAISVHSLFEGLAVGLQNTTSQLLSITAALLIHKGILSFSLGMNLVQSKLSKMSIVRSISLFCLSAPVGIAIGIGIIDLWDSQISSLVQGILQGIASGTFLYITFFEVLPYEFNSCDIRLVKVIFLIIGFGTVTAIIVI